jgi:hypothetical protein
VNTWQGREVNILSKDGAQWTATITNNDDTTIFFTTPVKDESSSEDFDPSQGWIYHIVEPKTGGVYKWDAEDSKWIVATGADAVRPGVTSPVNFTDNPAFNAENYVKDFGYFHKWDNFSEVFFHEIYTAINLLQKTAQNVDTWTSRHNPMVPENNVIPGVYAGGVTEPTFSGYLFDSGTAYASFGACTGKTIFTDWESALGAAQSDILAYLGTPVSFGGWPSDDCPPSNACGDCDCGIGPYEDTSSTAPFKYTVVESVNQIQENGVLDGDTFGDLGEGGGANVYSRYEYAKITGITQLISSTVDFWNYGDTYESTPPQDYTWSSYVVTGGADDGGDFYESSGNAVQFKNSGDPVNYHEWTQWDSGETPDDTGTVISSRLGSPTTGTLPTVEADPGAPSTNYEWSASATAGYSVTQAVAVITWDFDGAYPPDGSLDELRAPRVSPKTLPPPPPSPRVTPPPARRPCGSCGRARRADGKK